MSSVNDMSSVLVPVYQSNISTVRGSNVYVPNATEKEIKQGLRLPHSCFQGSGNLAASAPRRGYLDRAKILRILFSRVESHQVFLLVDPSPHAPSHRS